MTPTARSLRLLREAGYAACVVEKWVPQAKKRMDAFGFGDVLACHPGQSSIVLVQVTTASNLAARVTKAKSLPAAKQWLESGGMIELHGWVKRAKQWRCVRKQLRLIEGVVLCALRLDK
jgi:NADH:ubiquinone oxidoreductase subunit B-like Fe-S oxidoreductase